MYCMSDDSDRPNEKLQPTQMSTQQSSLNTGKRRIETEQKSEKRPPDDEAMNATSNVDERSAVAEPEPDERTEDDEDEETGGRPIELDSSDFDVTDDEDETTNDDYQSAPESLSVISADAPATGSPDASIVALVATGNGEHQAERKAADGDATDDDDRPSDDDPNDDEADDGGVIVNFLGKSNEIAEARLAQRRQARAEAREIRMRELERQQKEQEHNADRVFDMHNSSTGGGTALNNINNNHHHSPSGGISSSVDSIARSRLAISGGTAGMLPSLRGASIASSRRSSEDSLEEEGRSIRDMRHELKDVEERFRKAMIANAQLDNERASQTYQIQLLKDKLEEMEENYAQLQREHKDKCRDHDALKRANDKLTEDLKLVQGQLNERDQLITEQGLTIIMVETENGTDARRSLVSVENANMLESVQGSLDVRLKRFAEEKSSLKAEVQLLTTQLEELRDQRRTGTTNGPLGDEDYEEQQREANKQLADLRYKLQRSEQEVATLQSSLSRSETQVVRYKTNADASELAETELKSERRKLQRENREMSERLEELETANNHLLKRLEKLKNAKSALLKDL